MKHDMFSNFSIMASTSLKMKKNSREIAKGKYEK